MVFSLNTGEALLRKKNPLQQNILWQKVLSSGKKLPLIDQKGRFTMSKVFCSVFVAAVMVFAFCTTSTAESSSLPNVKSLLIDSVYVDDFNRPGPGLGTVWIADPYYEIVSNELANTDVNFGFNDLAVFKRLVNPIGLAFEWGYDADVSGMGSGGFALMLNDSSVTADGYFLFKHAATNRYKLWTINNGVVQSEVATSPPSEYSFFQPGDDFQVTYRTNPQGYHFDVFVNGRYDMRVSDLSKTVSMAPGDTVFAGVVLEGNQNNNIDDFSFWISSEDTIPPSSIEDLTVTQSTATSIRLTWTAPGDDDSTGTPSTYDVRYYTFPITELNWANSLIARGEPVPSPSGSGETVNVTGLETDTEYYFAIKSDDGFPQRNISGISNIATGATADNIAPAAIMNVAVEEISSRTVLLSWSASGDNDTLGVASRYDVRYSTSPISESNFFAANEAVGEPDPLEYGRAEEYTVGGMNPGTLYYFAVKAVDERSNHSPISNVPTAQTVVHPILLDDFERVEIGPDWITAPEFNINTGELTNESLEGRWDFMAIYVPVTNANYVSLRWGSNADTQGISAGGFALMLDAAALNADGYLLFKHFALNRYELYSIVDGAPDVRVGSSPQSDLPYPQAGDEFSVVMSTDANGHNFDCYFNGTYDTRVSDANKVQGNAGSLWSGAMLHGNNNNNLEDFWIGGPSANVAPGPFSLLTPANMDTVESGVPALDWQDSMDPNLSDSVLYTLYYGMSSVFSPDSTTVVDSLGESGYTVPPMSIISMIRANSKAGPELLALPDNVVIYWKVKAWDVFELETWSTEIGWSFLVSIPDPPHPFGLLSPADGDTVETLTPTLSWNSTTDPDPGDNVTYTLVYDDLPDFPSPVVIGGLEETSFATPSLNDETTYYWYINAVDSKDLETESNERWSFFVLLPSGLGDGGMPVGLPKAFALEQNYPNPFNPATTIRFDIPADEAANGGVKTQLQIFTIRGQLVQTLIDDVKAPGRYSVHWDGRDSNGERAGSGIYLYRIQAGTFNATKKMVVLK
jgi:hypothetical protein